MTLSHIRNKRLQKLDFTQSQIFDSFVQDLRRTGSLDAQLRLRNTALDFTETSPQDENNKDIARWYFLLDKFSCRCDDTLVMDEPRPSEMNRVAFDSLLDYDSDPEYMRREPISRHLKTENLRDDVEVRSDEWPMDELDPVGMDHTLETLKSEGVFVNICIPSETAVDMNSLPRRSSLKVKLWMERGHHTGEVVIQPKLVWRSGFHREEKVTQQDVVRSILPRPLSTGSIELLDITRIISSPELDREQFPFISKQNSFMIVTSNACLLFEVPSTAERENVVSALKVLVARFVSMIACQETHLIDEFFLPIGLSIK